MKIPHSPALFSQVFGDMSPHESCPDFWLPLPKLAEKFLGSLSKWERRVIGKSAEGREIFALEHGEVEELPGKTSSSLHSSLACEVAKGTAMEIFPASFYGEGLRKQPVVVIQCGIHGGENTGTVAALNLCSVLETGCDLRGKPWPRLTELALRSRVVIVPWLNPDGAARWLIPNPGGVSNKILIANTHGLNPDGSTGSYRGQKAFFPLDPSRVGYLGSYYNDSGVNLQYDVFQEKPQPETKAWMSYYRQMRPDAVVNFHCDAGSIMGCPDHYLPVGFQHLFSRIAGQVMARLVGEKLPVRRLSWAEMPGLGKPFLDQNTAIYHASGALPLMVELPGGGGTESPWTLDTLLDCGLLTLEEIFSAAHVDGLRPYMTRAKKSP